MAQPETVNRSRVNRRLFPEQRKTVELTAAETYVKKTIALIFRASTETGNNARRRSLNVESLIRFVIYRLAISSIRSIVVVRLF